MRKSFFKQNLYLIVSLFSYIIVFSALSLRALYSLSYYLVPSIIFLISFIINYAYLRGARRDNPVYFNILSFTIHLSVFLTAGFLAGFGLNAMLKTPLGYVLNFSLAFSTILYLESLRAVLTNTGSKSASPLIVCTALSLATSLMYTYVFEGVGFSANWFIKYLSFLAYSSVLSIIAWRFGFETQVLTITYYTVLFKLAPIIPARTSILLTTLPLILLSMLLSGFVYFFSKPATTSITRSRRSRGGRLINALLIALSVVMLSSFLLGVRFLAVSSGSMTPSINVGDIVVSMPVPLGEIRSGDVIVFRGGSGIVVHRVLGSSGENCFVTKGDANENKDPLWACGDGIIGKVVFTIPSAGLPTLYLLGVTKSLTSSISLILSLLSLIYVYYIVRGVVKY